MSPAESAYPAHPRLAVGAVVFKNGNVLLVKRGRPPGKGNWAIPGGNVQLGESLEAAARREVLEETGIVVETGEQVYTFESIVKDEDEKVQYHYVIVDFAAEYIEGKLEPGDDAADVRWVAPSELGALDVSPPTLKLLKNRYGFI